MRAFLFPGQGTQRIGMGRALGVAYPKTVEPLLAAAATWSPELTTLLRRGPEERLAQTQNAQLAVTTVNLCALEVLRSHGVTFDVVAGHSVGLLSALVAAEVLDVDAALALAARRGALMGSLPTGGALVSAVGLDPERAEAVARGVAAETGRPVVVALVNAPEIVVFSGAEAAVDRAAAIAAEAGARTTRLAVSHAFHSPLMLPALAEWRRVVEAQRLRPACVPVIADISGAPLTAVDDLRELLVEQMTTTVRWDLVGAQVERMGARDCVEVGDSKFLRALARPYPELHVTSLALPETLVHLRRHGSLPPPRGIVGQTPVAGAA